ncbi:hypothetical protein SUGI_0002510 [Cryptomeria japonica]|uniref:uncharacterized protein LOC131068219 isoform X1 n=1 Tax=Cryptomeria japonica TaxID=3369 RepID=UPI00240898E3|nr:uncharacterized protein LOC131068219 isoform X1 [Cryptomeria japonica]GLJ04746.1 hypothetical protein SUGI_0002510 [Cryptomeria japonica]
MKFKGFLTDNGVYLLERKFVPALEKIGKNCHLYLTKDHVIFLHNVLNADGVQAIAQFKKEVLFEDYRISSQNDDRIAFTVDLSLLLRALKSSVSMDGEKLQVKLVKKRTVGSERPIPFLTLESMGYKSAIIQDVPISNPLSRVDVHELQSALDMAQELPQTLVQVPDLVQLQSLIDRLKNVGEVLDVAITQYGDFHLKVSTTCITIGSDYRRLRVVGVRANDASSLDETVSSSARIERAIQRGEASSVQVNIKHFAKSIQCHLARPDAAFYGIATQGACLTVIFQFFVPGTRQTDNSISLHCRLPVLDPGFC